MNWGIFWIVIAILWSLPWKGWSIWIAARNKQRMWFFILLFVASLGILPIVYIFFFQKDKNKKKSKILKYLRSTKLYAIFKTRKGYRKRSSKKTK